MAVKNPAVKFIPTDLGSLCQKAGAFAGYF